MKKTRRDWINAAKSALLAEGVESVRVERLAENMGVSRGGFYGYFDNRQSLLDALLNLWRKENTDPILEALENAAPNGEAQYKAVCAIWLAEAPFSPAFDSAIRDWSRKSPKVDAMVRAVDEERIDAFKSIFLNMGYPKDESFIRARVLYYHQVGYYALEVRESLQERLRYAALYARALTGRDIT